MKTLRQSLGYLIAGILLFFLVKPFIQTHTDLMRARFGIHWGWLICAFVVLLFYWSVYLYPFALLLRGLSGKEVAFRDTFTLFHLSNITRYLPGRIWGVVRLLSLCPRFGLGKTAVAGSLTLHVGIETALGGLIAMTLLFSKQIQDTAAEVVERFLGQRLLLVLAVIVCLAGLVCLIPKVTKHVRVLLKMLSLLKNVRLWGNVLTCHILLWLCQGLAFFLFVKSLVPVSFTSAGVLIASFAFAWVVGFLSFLAPGGLGVREGLLGLLLTHLMPASQATLVALLCRLWMLLAEILLAGIAFGLDRNRRR